MTTASSTARARCVTLAAGVPDWIELLPAGPDITGVDGRAWKLPDPQTVVTAFQRLNRPLVIDWEHATETRAKQGLDAPAAGWIDQIEVRNGAIWGHVVWTERAAQQIAAKEYRYLSPVFIYQRSDLVITALTSAALTNTPNLTLPALNQQELISMPLPLALCQALELDAAASESDAVTVVTALKARLATTSTELATARNQAAVPPLEKFVPRADYDASVARATNAEQQLQTLQADQRKAKVDALIAKALNAAQITPATQDYYKAMCQTEVGIAEFEKFLTKQPPVIGNESGLPGQPSPRKTAGALTDTQRAVCQALNIVPADYAKHLNKEAD